MTAPRIQLAGRTSGQARGLVQRLAGYALSRGTTEVMLAVRGVLLAVSLGPSAVGTWALLRLIMRYSALSAIGVYRGLELELIQQRERAGPSDRTANSAALGFVLLVSGSIAGLAVGGSFLVPGETRLLLRAFAFASLAGAVYGYALVCTRTAGYLRRYAMLEWGTSVLHLLCAVGLAWRWGLAGAFVGLILANLLGLALASRWVELTPSWAWPPVRRMLRVGFPVVLTMALGIMLATVDRWAIALWGGTVMLGYYAFAGSVTTVAGTLAIVVRTVVFPSVYGQASTGGAAAALRTHLESALLPYARLLPPVLGLASLALAPLIAHTLPHYAEAIAPARIFLELVLGTSR